MPDHHPLEPLLSCLLGKERVNDMLGDLAEESRHPAWWACWQVPALFLSLWKTRFVEHPGNTLITATVTLGSTALVYCFLLIPFSLIHIDVQAWSMMIVLFSLRALACFTMATVIADAYGRKVSAGLMLAAVLMLLIMVMRLYALEFVLWLPAVNKLVGLSQHLLFYVLCSSLPVLAGCVYGLGCRHYRLAGQLREAR